ncbi:hypothetical protein ACT8ZV_11350 [Nocardioides sp. MAHUQ-72]|uniref:hypothetical protein n=1 Tax=unclassified Nocardioides TaxID=2615069 RepID=UPI003616CACD
MSITPSTWRSAVAVLSAAALLTVGADAVSYAATGHSVLLGKSNSASRATTITNTDSGPALALRSGKRSPSLTVSSSKLVKHLNAERLGGLKADQVAPRTLRLRTGTAGAPMPAPNLYQVSVPTGDYLVSMFGLYTSVDASPYLVCTLIDKQKLLANDITGAHLYEYQQDAAYTGQISQTNVVHLKANRPLVYGCNSDASTTQAVPLTVSLRKVNGVKSQTGTTFTPRTAPRLSRLLR